MFHVFAWASEAAHGGVNDRVGTFPALDSALSLAETMLHNGPHWECHITDDSLTVLFETDALVEKLGLSDPRHN